MKKFTLPLFLIMIFLASFKQVEAQQELLTMPANYANIMLMHGEFIRWERQHNLDIYIPPYLLFKAKDFNSLSNEGKFFAAVLGIDNDRKFTVDFVRTEKTGRAPHSRASRTLEKIRPNNQRLRGQIEGKPTLLREPFPSVIKMDAREIREIIRRTEGDYIILIPGIDNGRLTLSVLGSERNHPTVNRLHIANQLEGAETWPDDQFTLFGRQKPTDFELEIVEESQNKKP